jgi:hypothetical protein
MSISLIAVALALLVLLLVDDALGADAEPVGVADAEPVGVADAGAFVFVAVRTGALVPLAAVPEPLTVEALTVVDPEAFTLPEPLLSAATVVDPDALVVALSGFVVVGVLVVRMPPSSTGAAVPLAAVPEPLTVAAFTVVDPAALMDPEPLFVAFTVVEPDALVTAVCADADAPPKPRSAALTAAATRLLLRFDVVIVILLLSLHRVTPCISRCTAMFGARPEFACSRLKLEMTGRRVVVSAPSVRPLARASRPKHRSADKTRVL